MTRQNNYDRILNWWQKTEINNVYDLDNKLHNFRILFAFHSNKIENPETNYYDTREIFENGKVINFTGEPRTLLEQQNQKTCYDVLREYIVKRSPISIPILKEMHRLLTVGTYDERRYLYNKERSGEFKKADYVTGIYEVGSKPAEVEHDITTLINEVNSVVSADKLTIGAYLHARFEYIHPFADGNGRVGRTLLNYFLLMNNYPPVIIYDDDKKYYYETLETYDKSESIQPLYEFLKYETEKTWQGAYLRDNEAEDSEDVEL